MTMLTRGAENSAYFDGGPSGGSSVCRPGSEDPHRREQNLYNSLLLSFDDFFTYIMQNNTCVVSNKIWGDYTKAQIQTSTIKKKNINMSCL